MCFANIRTEDGEPIYISIAVSGVVVKKSTTGMFGKKLYVSKSADDAAKTARVLDEAFPNKVVPAEMTRLRTHKGFPNRLKGDSNSVKEFEPWDAMI